MGFAVLDHAGAFTHQAINGAHHVLFVAWDSVRAKHNHIGVFDLHVTVGAASHTVEHCVKLALATGTHQRKLTIRVFNQVFHFNNHILRDGNCPGPQGYLKVLDHAIASKRHLAPSPLGLC